MTDKITEMIDNVSTSDYNDFDSKTNSKLEYKRKTDNVSRDFSWLPIVEETIPYLDNIIRNPRRFIQQEEDIVIVEKSKKISTETIEHLAQHTNYIQEVDEDGMIRPSKVLNVQKEETWDLYENRFIFTLIKELARFIRKYTDKDLENPHTEIKSTVNYTGESAYKNEDIKISVNLETFKKEEPKNFNKAEMIAKIEELRNIVTDFENSTFIKSLAKAIPVKSPIRKTNVILKDVNFQKALALWEYMKNSEIGEPEDRSTYTENLTNNEIKKRFNLSYYLNYIGLGAERNEEKASPELLLDKINSLLEEYIDMTDLSERKLAEFITNEIKAVIKRKKSRENEIVKVFNKFIKEHNSYIENICDIV